MTKKEKSGERVVLEDPEHTNLIGILMRDLIAENMQDEQKYASVRDLEADVHVRAGDMAVTLRFGEGRLSILSGAQGKPRASVSGTMPALLGVVTGAGLVWPVVSGAIKVGGNPFLLLKMLPLIQLTT